MSTALVVPEQLKEEITVWGQEVNSITIVDQETYNAMAGVVVELTRLERQIIAHHEPIKKATDLAHKAAVKAEKDMLLPVQRAKADGKLKIVGWEREQERIRREQERLAREESERQAREVQEAQLREAREQQLQTAVQMEEQGSWPEDVQAVLDEPVSVPAAFVPAPIVPRTFERAAGVTTTERWSAEVVDIVELCRAIADGRASRELVSPNMTALNSMARAMKTTFNIPGCRAKTETTVGVRTN